MFRASALALLGVLFLILGESWVALASPWLKLLYLVPLGWAGWILWTRTVVDDRRLVAWTPLGRRVLAWSEVASLRVRERGWVHAISTSGSRMPLPCVYARHLPVLAAISGGKLADPLGAANRPAPTDASTDSIGDSTGDSTITGNGQSNVR